MLPAQDAAAGLFAQGAEASPLLRAAAGRTNPWRAKRSRSLRVRKALGVASAAPAKWIAGHGANIMDKAAFEIVGNVGKVEIKTAKGGKNIAILSVATSERWKRDSGDWTETTYWHRLAVFPSAKVERIEAQVQKGTRIRATGQIRPSSYETDRGETRYSIEFVVGAFGDLEILARGKPRETESEDQNLTKRTPSGKTAAAGDHLDA